MNTAHTDEVPVIPFDRTRVASRPPAYAFGGFVLVPALYELRARGQPVPIPPKVFDLLHHLIANRQRVVTHAELLAALWPGVRVTAGSITYAVKVARAILGDTGEAQGFIRNVRRRGYRFVAPVSESF